ncbi:MAG: hypothetical protein ACYDCL_07275 [Myxococcales bacterium]
MSSTEIELQVEQVRDRLDCLTLELERRARRLRQAGVRWSLWMSAAAVSALALWLATRRPRPRRKLLSP